MKVKDVYMLATYLVGKNMKFSDGMLSIRKLPGTGFVFRLPVGVTVVSMVGDDYEIFWDDDRTNIHMFWEIIANYLQASAGNTLLHYHKRISMYEKRSMVVTEMHTSKIIQGPPLIMN